MTGKEIREEVDNYLIKTREERKNVGLAKVPEFDERDIKQAYRDGMQSGLWHHSYDYLVKTADLKKRYEKQKEINKEQVDELEQWRAEVERQRLTALRNLDGWRKMDAKLTRAGEIIDRLRRLLDTSVFKNDAVVEAEKFLFEELLREEVPNMKPAEQTNECHDCAKFDEMPKGPRCKTCDNGSHFQKKEEA